MNKIDYEITVDVSEVDIETKKRVQDAFFKLGFEWWFNGNDYINLDALRYTNTQGIISGYLYRSKTRKPTHTIEQLLEVAA